MTWVVLEHPAFSEERQAMPLAALEKLAEAILTLEAVGPQLGRPLVDTLKASRHANMKELRFCARGAWRIAFAFDEERSAIMRSAATRPGATRRGSIAILSQRRTIGSTAGCRQGDD